MIDSHLTPSRPTGYLLGRAPVFLVLLGLGLILLALGLRSCTQGVNLQFPTTAIQHIEGHAYAIDLRRKLKSPWQPISDNLFGLYRSDMEFFEDGMPLGPSHAEHVAIQGVGGGLYSHWLRSIVFSSSDNSDPRTNGRHYSARVTAGMSQRILGRIAQLGGTILVLAGFLHAWVHRHRLKASLGKSGAHFRRRATQYLIAASAPALVSVVAIAFLPPTWNGSDSTIWLLWQLTWIPHHPPAYPAFMALANWLFDDALAVVRFAITIQHIALVLAIGYLASAYQQVWKIVVLSVLACLGSALGLYSHGLYTEGVALPFFLVFLGAVLRLSRGSITVPIAGGLIVGLLGAASTRHALLVFGVMPLTYMFIVAVLSRRQGAKAAWKGLWWVIGATSFAAVGSSLLTQYSCLLLDADCTSILGRAGVYRLQEAYNLVPTDGRDQWLVDLKKAVGDPRVAKAIEHMAKAPSPWTGPAAAIAADRELALVGPDPLMNAGYKAFALSFDNYAMQQWGIEIGRALLGSGTREHCPGQIRCILLSSAYSVEVVYPRDVRILKAASGTNAVDESSSAIYREVSNYGLMSGLDWLLPLYPAPRAALLTVTLALGVLAIVIRRQQSLAALLLSLLAGFVTYALTLTFVTVVLPRYLAPLDILIWVSVAISVIAILEFIVERRKSNAVE